jgi:hypothetical protein
MAELFQTHELMGRHERERVRPLLRWVGGSIAAHAVLVLCLIYVPAVRDTFMVASTLSGFRLVSRDYEKTKIYERATIINLAAQQLYFPYDLQNPTAIPPSPNDPTFVASVNPTPLPTPKPPRVKPTPSPSPSPSPSPTEEIAKAGDDGKNANGNKNANDNKPAGATPTPTPAEPQSAEEAERLAKAAGVEAFPKEINTKPFTDLLAQGKKMRDAGEIDLNGTIEMTVEADRQDDGRLMNVEVTGVEASNEKMKGLAKEFIAALSDSKLLATLKGTRHLVLKLSLNDKLLAVRVTSDMADEAKASQMANGYSMLVALGALSKKGQDEEQLFKSVKVKSQANQIVLDFHMPRKDAGELLSKLIKKNEPAPST